MVPENLREAERGAGSGEIWIGGVCGGVEMDVIRRKVGLWLMRRGEGRFAGGDASTKSLGSSTEGDGEHGGEFRERGDGLEQRRAWSEPGEESLAVVSLGS